MRCFDIAIQESTSSRLYGTLTSIGGGLMESRRRSKRLMEFAVSRVQSALPFPCACSRMFSVLLLFFAATTYSSRAMKKLLLSNFAGKGTNSETFAIQKPSIALQLVAGLLTLGISQLGHCYPLRNSFSRDKQCSNAFYLVF
jgi:hypothetical protein